MKASIDRSKLWYVARTNIKCEEKAADNLRKAGFDYYLPRQRVEIVNKRTHTVRTIERPLMLRYLFVGLDRSNLAFGFVRACEGVERILGDMDEHPIPVPAGMVEEIFLAETDLRFDDTRAARIHRREEARTKKENVARTFRRGRKVRALDGPFSSFGGVVEEVTSRGTVKALIEIFGRWTEVEFEPGQLAPAA